MRIHAYAAYASDEPRFLLHTGNEWFILRAHGNVVRNVRFVANLMDFGAPNSTNKAVFQAHPVKNQGKLHDLPHENGSMWLKQCQKPPMTGNGKHTTYGDTYGDLGATLHPLF